MKNTSYYSQYYLSFLAVATVVLTIITPTLTTFTIDINMTCRLLNLQYPSNAIYYAGQGIRFIFSILEVATML
jgi:hypothetical protein